MLDSNTILGIRGNLGCEDYVHGILTQEWEGWPCGGPIVYPNVDLVKCGGSVNAISLITPSQNSGGRDQAHVATSVIAPVNMRPLCKNHKVMTVSAFDIGKLDRLVEYVKDVGGISLVIEYNVGRKAAPNDIQKIERYFKYSSMFYYNGWGSKHLNGEDDRYICVLTLLDLPYCVPLFNTRKVDGIGLSFSGATVDASKTYGQLHRIFRTDFIYSNFEDNVFVIDGVTVNKVRPMSSDVRRELTQMAGQELPVQKKKKINDSSKKKEMSGYEKYRSFGKDEDVNDHHAQLTQWKTSSDGMVINTEAQPTLVVNSSTVEESFPPFPEDMAHDEAPPSFPEDEAPDDAPEEATPEEPSVYASMYHGGGTLTVDTDQNNNIVWTDNVTIGLDSNDEEEV